MSWCGRSVTEARVKIDLEPLNVRIGPPPTHQVPETCGEEEEDAPQPPLREALAAYADFMGLRAQDSPSPAPDAPGGDTGDPEELGVAPSPGEPMSVGPRSYLQRKRRAVAEVHPGVCPPDAAEANLSILSAFRAGEAAVRVRPGVPLVSAPLHAQTEAVEFGGPAAQDLEPRKARRETRGPSRCRVLCRIWEGRWPLTALLACMCDWGLL